MIRFGRFGLLVAVCAIGVQADAQDNSNPDAEAWLNGFTAGRALAGFYENGDREAFIRGVLAGLGETHDGSIDDDEIRERKMAWFTDDALSKKEQASYAAGYISGDAYQESGSVYSTHSFAQGLLGSLQAAGARYVDKNQGALLVSDYQRAQFYRMKREVANNIQANERAGAAFLANNALQPGVVRSESGLQYKVISPGDGDSPAAEDMVVVSLVGRKIDGQVFYDSHDNGSGNTTIRVDQTLNGWQEALVQMSVGEEWELYLPANLAYGNAGWQGLVDPGETLIYSLKLIDVIKAQ
jgi:FKBP-type peptidyl-prolyl cis-trans isomerase FklB